MPPDPPPRAKQATSRPDRLSDGDTLFRAVLDAALDGIIVIDRKGLILTVN